MIAQRLSLGSFGAIWVATALLFALCLVIAPSSLSNSSLMAMLPYAAILAVIAAGQTLVAQQAGIDLSVPGMVSLGAIFVTKIPDQAPHLMLPAILVSIVAGVAAGAGNGLCVAVGRITPIVATLGTNALLMGFIQWYSRGFPTPIVPLLGDWAVSQVFGIPAIAVAAVGILSTVQLIIRATIAGRRFEAVGANPLAATAAGLHTDRYVVAGYAAAGGCYAAGGVLLAAFLKTPDIFVGESYLLPSVAAVVLGGTALTGGLGSIVATAVAAVFLSQLGQLVLSVGAPTPVQWIIQALTIAMGMAWRQSSLRVLVARMRSALGYKIARATGGY
ncbi:MAG: ABC transporter permease [Bradyrhizobium sp.]|uniref:ABC transporter permease n=1 Tax=Bradyrhizobium sp. TaxID=376 RepID=UPI001E0FFD2D|nr:ABC transporter permease [Bradyrhizobium sp.]MBV9560376.1 ABC transporter permease [Bradyrhizobium sp.]